MIELQIAVSELGANLAAALRQSVDDGTVGPREGAIAYSYYWRGRTFDEIAHDYAIPVAAVRRAHTKTLHALRNTGLVEGYGAEE